MLKFWFCVDDLKRDNPYCNRDNHFVTEIILFVTEISLFVTEHQIMCVSDAVRWCSKCSLCNETLSKVDLEILYSIYTHSIYVIFLLG